MNNGNGTLTIAKPGASVRESAGGATELMVRGETAAETLAARAQAQVYGSMQLAKKFPRDMDVVRQELLKDCSRPAFAEKARYALKRGTSSITGFTIRFAEALLRRLTNISVDIAIIYEDAEKRIISVRVIDLESNTTMNEEKSITKQIERRYLKDGQTPISARQNSAGETTYLVEATEDEVLQKQGVAQSKAIRNLVLRMADADLLEEAGSTIVKTKRGEIAKDPDAARRKMLDAFASMNVRADEVKRYIGHDVGSCSPAEVEELRDLYEAIRDGQTTWAGALAEKLDGKNAYECEVCGESLTARAAGFSAKAADGKQLCKAHLEALNPPKAPAANAAAKPKEPTAGAAAPAQAPKPAAPPVAPATPPAATADEAKAPATDEGAASPAHTVNPAAPSQPLNDLRELQAFVEKLNPGEQRAFWRKVGHKEVPQLAALDATMLGVALEEARKRAKR